MFKVNNKNTITRWERCSKLTIKTPEQGQWCFFCELRAGKCRLWCHFVPMFTFITLSNILQHSALLPLDTHRYVYVSEGKKCMCCRILKVLIMGIWAPNRLSKHRQSYFLSDFNPFQPSKVFHTETTHLICCATLKLR